MGARAARGAIGLIGAFVLGHGIRSVAQRWCTPRRGRPVAAREVLLAVAVGLLSVPGERIAERTEETA